MQMEVIGGEQSPGGTEFSPEWQKRLESLQVPKDLSAEQQRLHLAQLLELQDQLLGELATQCTGEEPLDIKSELLSSLELSTNDETSFLHSPHSPATPQLEEYPLGQDVTETEQTTSSFPPSSGPSIASTEYLDLPVSRHEESTGKSTVDQGTQTAPHLEFSSKMTEVDTTFTQDLFCRSALVEKHAKHIDDIQNYYESQLEALRQQMTAQEERALQLRIAPEELDHSPLKMSERGPCELCKKCPVLSKQLNQLSQENQQLSNKCSGIEQDLEEHHKGNTILHERNIKLQKQLHEWQQRTDTSDQEAAAVQTKLSSALARLRDKDNLISELNSELDSVFDELEHVRLEKKQIQEEFREVCDEMDILQQDWRTQQLRSQEIENSLADRESEVVYLKGSLEQQSVTMEQYLSTVRELEDKVRRLNSANNRLKSQATHFTLGSPNVSDEGKISDTSTLNMAAQLPQDRHHFAATGRAAQAPTITELQTHRHQSQASNRYSKGNSHGEYKSTRRKWVDNNETELTMGYPPSSTQYLQVSDRPSTVEWSSQPAHWTPPKKVTSPRKVTSTESREALSLEERVEKKMQLFAEAEKKLDALQKERELLESIVSKSTPPGFKAKQQRRETEEKLDKVIKEIGSLRIILRQSSTWKK